MYGYPGGQRYGFKPSVSARIKAECVMIVVIIVVLCLVLMLNTPRTFALLLLTQQNGIIEEYELFLHFPFFLSRLILHLFHSEGETGFTNLAIVLSGYQWCQYMVSLIRYQYWAISCVVLVTYSMDIYSSFSTQFPR